MHTSLPHNFSPVAGLGPAIHAFLPIDAMCSEDVGAHGTSPWAEGPRDTPGHGGSERDTR